MSVEQQTTEPYSSEELLICVIARLLHGIDHVAVGVSSPIPGSAALLQRALAPDTTRVTVLNSRELQSLNDGVSELFDMAAQGRVREEHTRRTMVDKVDFISAPGSSEAGVYRPGGPHALITNLCAFSYQKDKACFRLESIHPGHTLEEVQDQTGFTFELPDSVPETPVPEPDRLHLLRTRLAREIADPYPSFASRVWNVEVATP